MIKAATPGAFKLMMKGAQAFADVEHHGVRIDTDYLERAILASGRKIKYMESQLREDEVYRLWRKKYGEKSDLASRIQLGDIIFNELGVECKHRTKREKRPKTDEESLEEVDFPFVKRLINLEKLKKARGTYLLGIQRETVDGFLHPFFHVHFAVTYRSSCSEPNLQNQPIRDKRQAKLIRRAFIPRDGHRLVEIDYGALEFRGAANFWKDERMIAYASDRSLDIHRDMAAECYALKTEEVTKDARFYAKNQFVFPTLYGSYFGNTSTNLWTAIGRAELKTNVGLDLYDHLSNEGIGTLEIFEDHVKEVEDGFHEKFSHWSEQRDVWWNDYLKRGWFPLVTGFVCSGIFSYNDLMNYPIQGPSFHCLLWSLIRLNDWLKRHRMRSKIVTQIHDSILADVHEDELDDYLEAAVRIMTVEIREEWPWIVTPLEVEVETSSTNWFEKEPMELCQK